MSYIKIPEPPVEPPERNDDDVAETCSLCGQPIFYEETYGEFGDKRVCPDCLEEAWDELTVSEKYARLDYHPVRRVRPEGRRRR